MKRRQVTLTVVITLLLIVGLFAVSQLPNVYISAHEGKQASDGSEMPAAQTTQSGSSSAAALLSTLGNPYQIADIAEAANPATVYIQVVWPTADQTPRYWRYDPFSFFFGFDIWGLQPQPAYRERITQGSGFIIDEKGIVLTNQHVVGDAGQGQKITVTVTSPQISGDFTATILGSDARLDLAVLQIEDEGPFPTVPLGDSDKTRQGEWVIAIGNPYGKQFDHTVTVGVLSAKGREIEIVGSDRNRHIYKNLMQIDAAINSGNSGGPLLNIEGEVIGINTAVHAEAQGIGFAIPINVAKEVLQELIETGGVALPPEPWIGIYHGNVSEEIRQYFGLPDTNGVFISGVVSNSPAAEAGIRPGDVIRQINNRDIVGQEDLLDIISELKVGDTIMITILRGHDTMLLPLTVGNKPEEHRTQ